MFWKKTSTSMFFDDIWKNPKHRTNDATNDVNRPPLDLLRHNILSGKLQESVWKWSSSHKWSCTHTVLYPQQVFSQTSLSLFPSLSIAGSRYIMTPGSFERVEQEATFSCSGHGIVDIEPFHCLMHMTQELIAHRKQTNNFSAKVLNRLGLPCHPIPS